MSSVPAVAERAGWQTRRVRRLPQIAALYVGAICLAALAAAAASLAYHGADGHDWTAFALLLPLAAVAPFFRVAVGRNYSLHTGAAFIVAGALVLHPLMVLALVAALHIPQFVRGRYPWYIHLFNLANYVLSALAAWLAVGVIRGAGDFRFAAAGVAAAITFVAVNHALLAVMLRLGRGHSFRQSGLFSPSGLAIELVLVGLGVAVGAFARFNPWILPVLIAPLVLAHRSLATVALLRESEERFRTMFAAAPTAIMLFDREGRILAANRSAESLFGYSEQELVGKLPTALRHPDDVAAGRRPVRRRGEGRARLVPTLRDQVWLDRCRAPRDRARPRRRRKAQLPDRHGRGRDGAAPARGAAAAEPEAGGDRPPGRRRRARLQQHADRDRRLHRARPRARADRLHPPRRPRGDPQGDRPRCDADTPAARLQPQAGADAGAPQPERHRSRAGVDAPPADRRGRTADDAARSQARADRGRPRPAAPGRDEPRRQRPRRDAERRCDHDRDRERRASARTRTRSSPAPTSR